MAWAGSSIFRVMLADRLGNVNNMDLSGDSLKVALYNNTITPDNDVTAANSAYNVGQWATAQEVWEVTQWPQAGPTLDGVSLDSSVADTVFLDATDEASGANADLANVHGCLVYSDTTTTVVDQGICYNYFGGANSVVDGTFTIVWHANGIFRYTQAEA